MPDKDARKQQRFATKIMVICLTGIAILAIFPWVMSTDALGMTIAVIGSALMGVLVGQLVMRGIIDRDG